MGAPSGGRRCATVRGVCTHPGHKLRTGRRRATEREERRIGQAERKERDRASEGASGRASKRTRGMKGGKVAERVAKKESGGERGARNLRAGVLQPSWGVAARCIAYLPAEMHVLARRQVRATPPYPSHHFVVLLLAASPELAPFSHSFHRSSLWRTDTNTITLTSARAFSRFPCFACRARSVDARQ